MLICDVVQDQNQTNEPGRGNTVTRNWVNVPGNMEQQGDSK
jgi:hypothetical protein